MTDSKKCFVIGAGLSRTGTMTTKKALEELLNGKCYHMIEALTHDHDQYWCDVFNGQMSDEDFRNFFRSRDYIAGVNFPLNACLEQCMRAFPNAKVIVTLRDPNTWVESVKETLIFSRNINRKFPLSFFIKLGIFRRYLPWLNFQIGETKNRTFKDMLEAVEEDRGPQFYANWLEHVKTLVPKDRLLFLHIKEGWGPLCQFLDLPQPDKPFPRVNDKQQFINRVNLRERKAWLLVYEVVSITTVVFYTLYKVVQKCDVL